MTKTFDVIVNSLLSKLVLDSDSMRIEQRDQRQQTTLSGKNIDHIDWFLLNKNATLHVYTTGKRFYSISNLSQSDKETIGNYLIDQLQIPRDSIVEQKIAFKGHNDGELRLNDKSFSIVNESLGGTILNLPYSKITQAQATLNDLMIDFEPDDEDECDSLYSLRLYIPEDHKQTAKDIFLDLNMRTNLTAGTEDFIAELREIKFVKPKKKFKLRFCKDLLFISSSDVSHRIKYKNITLINRLEIPSQEDEKEEYILLSLERPVRQGQKAYPYLVISASSTDPIKEGYSEGYTGNKPAAAAIEELMHNVGEIKVANSSGVFRNECNDQGNRCLYKGSNGCLYLTDKAFIFLHSHVLYIPYSRVKTVKFDNLEELIRKKKRFDLTIEEKNNTYSFSSIDTFSNLLVEENDEFEGVDNLKREHCYNGLNSFFDFLKKKNIKIVDRESVSSFLRTFKLSSRERSSKIQANENIREEVRQNGADDNDEEEDEDFNPNAKNEESSSSSDEDDEINNNDSGSGSGKDSD